MSELAENLKAVLEAIGKACQQVQRSSDSVNLIAVSKTMPSEAIREVYEEGQHAFGESKLQEAEGKILSLPGSIHWHFIGNVQRNKVRKILQNFNVIHGISSTRLARHTSEVAKELGISPQIFLQVNLADEASKGGFQVAELHAEMDDLLALQHIDIVGLMCIPPPSENPEGSRKYFVELRGLRDELEKKFSVRLPSLSMGMSDDYLVAIEEGATHIRVGSAIFGKRAYRVQGELG